MKGRLLSVLSGLPLPCTPQTLGYVSRSVAAATLALWLGLQLHLDAPFSAASTVLLLIHPIQGAVVGKGFHRVLGTLVGIVAAFVLTALFAQKMLLFILGVGVWLGLCVGAMTVLRHYHATAAVVAGYTVCLALGPAIVAPEQSFEHIVTRGTAVVLGVFSLSLVATLFSRKTVEQKLNWLLISVTSRTIRWLAIRLSGEQDAHPSLAAGPLSLEISQVDDLLGIGRGESALIRSRLPMLQAGLAYLQGVVLAESTSHRSALPAIARIGRELQPLGDGLADATQDFSTAAERVRAMQHWLAGDLERHASDAEYLDESLADLCSALLSFASLQRNTQVPARAVGFHRHYGDALRNGLRALLAILATAAIWYLTGWDQGPTLLAVVGPCCTLLATSAAPTQGMRGFIKGTLYGILAAAACKFLLLPHISGFALLSVVLAAFWIFGMHATTRPRHALQGIAYLIAFNTLVSTGETAHYDFVEFANQALAWMVALAVCLLAFQLFPKKSASPIRALRQALERDTRRLLRQGSRLDRLGWQAKQQHRMVSLLALLGADQPQADPAGYVSLQLSRSLGRLQRKTGQLAPGSAIAECAQRGARRLSRHALNTAVSAAQARRTAKSMRRLGAPHLAACYEELAGLLEQYGRGPDHSMNERARPNASQLRDRTSKQ